MFFYHTYFSFVIKNDMEQEYNDSLMPSDFEQMAKAYSKHLKDKGFVFVRLEEEEFNLLLAEIFVLLSKIEACLKRLENQLEAERLKTSVCNAKKMLQERFGTKKQHSFECVENENNAFLSLVAIENMLVMKLMILSVKSGEIELCNEIIASICSIFAESFSCEGFALC